MIAKPGDPSPQGAARRYETEGRHRSALPRQAEKTVAANGKHRLNPKGSGFKCQFGTPEGGNTAPHRCIEPETQPRRFRSAARRGCGRRQGRGGRRGRPAPRAPPIARHGGAGAVGAGGTVPAGRRHSSGVNARSMAPRDGQAHAKGTESRAGPGAGGQAGSSRAPSRSPRGTPTATRPRRRLRPSLQAIGGCAGRCDGGAARVPLAACPPTSPGRHRDVHGTGVAGQTEGIDGHRNPLLGGGFSSAGEGGAH